MDELSVFPDAIFDGVSSTFLPPLQGCSETNLTESSTSSDATRNCFEHERLVLTPRMFFLSVVLSAVIIGTVIGNSFVVISVIAFDKMRTLSNGLIASLASADLLVAVVVLPISLQVRFAYCLA
jgi:hypothetical protein